VTVEFRYTTGDLTGKKYRGAEGYYGVEPEIAICV